MGYADSESFLHKDELRRCVLSVPFVWGAVIADSCVFVCGDRYQYLCWINRNAEEMVSVSSGEGY